VNTFAELKSLLSNYNSIDLLSTAAALQLLPENAGRFVRLETLSCMVASLHPELSSAYISQGRLRNILNSGFLAGSEVSLLEDPQEYHFTDTFGFDGGPFVVFPGPATDTAYILQNLLRAIFKYPEPIVDSHWLKQTHQLVAATLILSDEVVRRAELSRSVNPVYQPASPVFIPTKDRMQALKKAVTFTKPELQLLLDRMQISLQVLEPLIAPQGRNSMPEYEPLTGELYIRPLVEHVDTLVVSLPHCLLNALRHTLLVSAQKHELTGIVGHRFSEAVWFDINESLQYLEIKGVAQPLAIVHTKGYLVDATFRFDTDKALHVIQVSDALDNFDASDAFGNWEMQEISNVISRRIEEIGAYLSSSTKPPNEVLFLLIAQGLGRAYSLSLPNLSWAKTLYLSAADLKTIVHLEAGDSLLLWKYLCATEQAREKAFIHKPDELAQFYFYRKNLFSYYFTDNGKPDLISLMPGYAQELREEERHSRDRHFVPSYRNFELSEVMTLFSDRTIPIYFVIDSLGWGATELLVKELPLPVWVVNAPYDTDEQRENRKLYAQLTETIAYWIWQFSPSLQAPLDSLAPIARQIQIKIDLKNPSKWGSIVTTTDNSTQMKVAIVKESATISLTLFPGMKPLFYTPDNTAEREVMRQILRAFIELFPLGNSELLSESIIESILDRHAPLGKKKKLTLIQVSQLSEIQGTGLPNYRKVQDADLSNLLDELGRYLVDVKGLSMGEVPDEKRNDLLQKVVTFFYETLQNLVSSLHPEGLLEWLVAYQEAVTYNSAFHQLMIPTRLACFSSESELVKDLQKETPEYNSAQVSSRFVVEYVTANPPRGLRPISLSVYDRLQAIALLIVNYGTESDLIHFGLADHKMAILKSGRLGLDRDGFRSAQKAWLPVWTQGNINRANRYFDSLWDDKSAISTEQEDLIKRLNKASMSEFKFTLSEQNDFAMAASELGKSLDLTVACLQRKEFITRMAEKLSWTFDRVESALAMLSLSPRSNFLQPPTPYRPEDVYPWRFNRDLSYLRRPFLIRFREENNLDTAEVIWGVRHLASFWKNLSGLCFGGRLKAKSPEMVKLLGEMNNNRGERFNTQVAEVFRGLSNLIVKERVKKIGSLRLIGDKGDLGDIDVIVADKKHACLFPIECKDLAQARTPYEMAGEIENLFRGRQGHKSIVELHKQRIDWLQKNLDTVLKWLGVTDKRRWKIEPIIVVDSELITPFIHSSPIPILPIEQLIKTDGNLGHFLKTMKK
jgi:hypothetical protein